MHHLPPGPPALSLDFRLLALKILVQTGYKEIPRLNESLLQAVARFPIKRRFYSPVADYSIANFNRLTFARPFDIVHRAADMLANRLADLAHTVLPVGSGKKHFAVRAVVYGCQDHGFDCVFHKANVSQLRTVPVNSQRLALQAEANEIVHEAEIRTFDIRARSIHIGEPHD